VTIAAAGKQLLTTTLPVRAARATPQSVHHL
jgi:hypothetical protein